MAKPVDKKLYKNYLQKAGEMLDMAQYALTESKNNAAVMASVHCSISAMDALAVFYFVKRPGLFRANLIYERTDSGDNKPRPLITCFDDKVQNQPRPEPL